MREDVIQRGIAKALKVYNRMIDSRDMNYTVDTVKIAKDLSIKIECVRNDVDYEQSRGRAYGFEFYAVKNGEEIDCCSLHLGRAEDELRYLLNCYV